MIVRQAHRLPSFPLARGALALQTLCATIRLMELASQLRTLLSDEVVADDTETLAAHRGDKWFAAHAPEVVVFATSALSALHGVMTPLSSKRDEVVDISVGRQRFLSARMSRAANVTRVDFDPQPAYSRRGFEGPVPCASLHLSTPAQRPRRTNPPVGRMATRLVSAHRAPWGRSRAAFPTNKYLDENGGEI